PSKWLAIRVDQIGGLYARAKVAVNSPHPVTTTRRDGSGVPPRSQRGRFHLSIPSITRSRKTTAGGSAASRAACPYLVLRNPSSMIEAGDAGARHPADTNRPFLRCERIRSRAETVHGFRGVMSSLRRNRRRSASLSVLIRSTSADSSSLHTAGSSGVA